MTKDNQNSQDPKKVNNLLKTQQNQGFPLNPEQKKAAEAPISPLLIVAGAGTGKTRTLISRIVYLIATGIRPERICAITFTNKAAQEMMERIGAGGSAGASGKNAGLKPYIGTFHSLGARILRSECRVFGREPNFAIFDDHDSFDLIKKAAKTVLPPKFSRADGGTESAAEKKKKKEAPALFAKKISEIKNLDAIRPDSRMSDEKKKEIEHVFELYESALQRNNAFDFDDLIQKPVAMFKAHPEILKKYQNKYDAILVDEYQDINPKQYEFIKCLAGGHRNLTVVGDDEQTIYTWRYADIKTFLDFDKDWPGAAVHFLEENYRSTGNIIRGASTVVQNNKFRTPKKLWTKKDDGDKIVLYEAWGENEEAAWIGDEIRKIKRRDAGAEVAILYRTNAQSRAIEQALLRESIPYKIFGGLKFYERREVKDAVSALRYASNTRDEVSRERLEKNLTKRKFTEFRDAVLRHAASIGAHGGSDANAAAAKPTDIIKIFLEVFNYFDYLESNFINADERAENIAELINFASGFESLAELLERLSLVQSTDDNKKSGSDAAGLFADESQKAVHLSTIHLAKGLEFDNVFIAGAAEGLLPHIRSIDNDASLEEERRLMYVAMTRARKNLFISFYGVPSRFVGEIPEEHVTLAGSESGGGDGGENRRGYGSRDDDHKDFDFEEEYIDL